MSGATPFVTFALRLAYETLAWCLDALIVSISDIGVLRRPRISLLWSCLFAATCMSCAVLLSGLTPPSFGSTARWKPEDYMAVNSYEFRLLFLQPAKLDSKIEAKLKIVKFSCIPAYEALSYTWGNPNGSETIIVNDMLFRVTDNLWHALNAIRSQWEERVIWVDAICINQLDIEEKNQQVPFMPAIYGRARKVLVWLGYHSAPRWTADAVYTNWDEKWAIQEATKSWHVTEHWIYRISEEEYWKRCWIIQEVALATNIQVVVVMDKGQLIGKLNFIPWSTFVKLIELYDEKVHYAREATQRILNLEKLRNARVQDISLTQLMEASQDCFATRPADKLYALFNMASECVGIAVCKVDYQKSPHAIYKDLLRHRELFSHRRSESQIDMVYFAATVRALLSRQSFLGLRYLRKPDLGHDLESWAYRICSSDECRQNSFFMWLVLIEEVCSGLYHSLPHIWSTQDNVKSAKWLSSWPENVSSWTRVGNDYTNDETLLTIRGLPAGEIIFVSGYSYWSLIADPSIQKFLAQDIYLSLGDLMSSSTEVASHIKSLSQSLASVAMSTIKYKARNFVALDDTNYYAYLSSRVFLARGKDNAMFMGIAPKTATVGCILVQFWKTDAALVVRHEENGTYTIVGRAAIVRPGATSEWDTPTDVGFLESLSQNHLQLQLSIEQLTRLSLDTIILLDSWGEVLDNLDSVYWQLA